MISKYQRSLLPILMRHHQKDESPETAQILSLIRKDLGDDYFSLSQWEIGLAYYRQRFKSIPLNGKLMLDLGCGTGNWSIAAADYFEKVIGIDIREDRIAIASQIKQLLQVNNVIFLTGELSCILSEVRKADCILIYNTIQCIPQWKLLLTSISKQMCHGSSLWISWQEIGVCFFYALQALSLVDIKKMKSLMGIPLKHFINRFIQPLGNGVYLNHAQVIHEITKMGFRIIWRSWIDPWPANAQPLFPTAWIGLPFFYEMLVVKE
jgi:2-polyprenyl-3-methyl-5-hydroxy-6-metoxy-1,4-benzoquinol methylase